MAEQEKAVITYKTEQGVTMKLSPSIIRRFIAQGKFPPDDVEVVMFMKTCEAYKMNPYLKEVYLLKFTKDDPATIVVGKDTFNKRAAKHPQYDGMRSGIVVQDTIGPIEEREGTLLRKDEILLGGWAEVYRKDWEHPVKEVVSLEEYIGLKKDGTPNRQWKRMPATMICKVAKVHAWGEAFPDILGGLLDQSEVNVNAEELNTTPITPKYEVDPQESAGEESQAKSEEYLEIEAQIIRDVTHVAFKGEVVIDGRNVPLDQYRTAMPDSLAKNILSIDKLREKADTIAMLLQAAVDLGFTKEAEKAKEAKKGFVPPEGMKVGIDIPESQGNLYDEVTSQDAAVEIEREGNAETGGGK